MTDRRRGGIGSTAGVAEFVRHRAWQLMAAATSLVILWSGVRGVAAGYQPVSDNALVELRARDVLTADHPFLGTATSASISAGIDVNHPGPLLFDVVALPLRVFGGPAGIAIGVMALQVAVVWTVGWVTHRVGGRTAAISAMTVTALLVWTLGSELLYDPWQPNVLVLPFWAFMCTVWAVAAGDTALLPLACGIGSFVMQTHLGYLPIVAMLLGFVAVLTWRSTPVRHELRRPVLQSVGVILLLWAQPLWEQFFGPGRGNIGRIITAGTGGSDDFDRVESTRTGVVLGVRILGSVLALPPWWGRPGYDDSIPASEQTVTTDGLDVDVPALVGVAPALLGLSALAAALGVAWWAAHRAGERRVVAGHVILAAALVVASATVVLMPIDIIGLSPHKVRWLWVIGAFSTLMLVMSVLVCLDTAVRRRVVAGLGVVGAVALVATLPTHVSRSGPTQFEATYPSIDAIRSQLSAHFDDSPVDGVLFDPDGIGFGEPYTAPVMAELLASGVDLVVDDITLSRQLGPGRLADGETLPVVYVRAGPDAYDVPDGVTRIAFHDGDPTPFSLNDVTDRTVAVFITNEAP